MIDSVRLHSTFYKDDIDVSTWNEVLTKDGLYYQIFINGVWLAYYPNTHSLIISGRILKLVHNERSKNLDDIFVDIADLTEFFCSINKVVNQYIINKKFDVLKMKTSKIDFCVNIFTPWVDTYVTLFNLIYVHYKDTRFKRYKNYVYENDLEYNSSFYLKTNNDFDNNTRKNFVVNFYNKSNQLETKRQEEIALNGYSSITQKDIDEMRGCLRMDVQVCYTTLRRFCKTHNIPWKKRTLLDFIDISLAMDVIKYEVGRFFTLFDFYTYDEVVKILKDNGFKSKDKIFDYVYKISHHMKTSSYRKHREILEDLDICPLMFIPSKFKIKKLKNPYKLVEEKIKNNNLEGLTFKQRKR